MTRRTLACLAAAGFALTLLGAAAMFPGAKSNLSAEEARQRARLLHGTIHDTLQVVHARYFREGERLAIPAAAMRDVFDTIEDRDGVTLRWLVVDGSAMNVDHRPQDAFEKEAAAALASGKPEHEQASGGVYRYAGPITLRAECLKCHLPSRSSNKERTAGLLISMPLARR